MGKDYGEPIRYDPDFNGPTRNRSCTDVVWLIVFILFLGGWGYVGYYGLTQGNVEKLLAPIDSKGRRCGVDSGLEDKKYLVFFNITKCLTPGAPITGCPTPQVCVTKCPDRTIIFQNELTLNPLEQLRKELVCTDDVDTNTLTIPDVIRYMQEEKCASYVVQSQPGVGWLEDQDKKNSTSGTTLTLVVFQAADCLTPFEERVVSVLGVSAVSGQPRLPECGFNTAAPPTAIEYVFGVEIPYRKFN